MAKELVVKTVFKAVDKISQPLRRMQSSMGRFSNTSMRSMRMLEMRFNRVNRSIASIGKTGFVAATAGSVALGLGISKVVKEFSKLENAEAAFTPLLKSGKKAKEMVEAIQATASTTPFQFENLQKSVGQLLPVMNGDIQNTIKTLRMIGDTAGGDAQKLEGITRGFTKAMLKGKVDMESFNMIVEKGVPILDDLRKVATDINFNKFKGTTDQEKFFSAMRRGLITTDHLTKAFERITSKGGIFFRGMEIASKTTTGKLSTMMDNFSLMLARVGGAIAPELNKLFDSLNKQFIDLSTILSQSINQKKLVQTFKDVFGSIISMLNNVGATVKALLNNPSGLDNLKTVIGGIVGLTKFIITNATEIVFFGAAWVGLSIAIKGAAVAMGAYNMVLVITSKISKAVLLVTTALNIAMRANPIGLLITGVAALIALPQLIINNWDSIKSFFSSIWDGIKRGVGVAIDALSTLGDYFNNLFSGIFSKFGKLLGLTSNKGLQLNTKHTQQLLAPSPISQRPTAEGLNILDKVTSTKSTTENFVTIRDETGRAEMQGFHNPFVQLLPSGA